MKTEDYVKKIEHLNKQLANNNVDKKLVSSKINFVDSFIDSEEFITDALDFEEWCMKHSVDYSQFKEVENFVEIGDLEPIELYLETLEDLYEVLAEKSDNIEASIDLLEEELDEYELANFESDSEEHLNAFWHGKEKRKEKRTERQTKRADRKDARKSKRDARKKKRQDKRTRKRELRDTYGKGKDYREAKRDMKREVKAEKRTAITEANKIIDRSRTFVGKITMKGSRAFKTFNAIGPRNAFLALLKINILGLASKLKIGKDKKESGYQSFEYKWKKWGGSPTSLRNAIIVGAKHKPKLPSKKTKEYLKSASINYNNLTGAGESALIASASTFVITALTCIANMGKNNPEVAEKTKSFNTGEEDELLEDATLLAKEQIMNDPNLTDEQKSAILTQIDDGIDPLTAIDNVTNQSGKNSMMKYILWGGIGTVGIVGTVLIIKAIKKGKK